jgi:NADH-quinone oxidoreductase subunit N
VSAFSQFFHSPDYTLALPMVMLALFGCGILIIDLLLPDESKVFNAWAAFVGLIFSAIAVYNVHSAFWAQRAGLDVIGFHGFNNTILVDRFAIYFFYLFLAAAMITVLASAHYLEVEKEHHGEFYALILFSVMGMMGMACGNDLIVLFISLELMAISTYILVGFLRRDRRSNEAALKYLLLGAFSSGIFAYGLSLLYGISGVNPGIPASTNLTDIARALGTVMTDNLAGPVVVLALLTTATGLLFKIAAVPFHQWAPDAYEGAPTSITGFMSVAGKAAAWALLLRIFLFGLYPLRALYLPMIIFVAIVTLTVGNLAAITQNNLKRLLAYSSISHVGYMLLGLVAGNATGIQGILFYLLVYTFMNLGAFAVITSLRRRAIIGDEIDDIAGLYQKAPGEALLMMVFLLALAGIPPLAGFYGKYFIFLSLIQTQHYALALLAVAYSAVALYYYLRIVNAMFMKPALDAEPVQLSPGMGLALAVTAAATIGIGLFPEWFINAASWSVHMAQSGSLASLIR